MPRSLKVRHDCIEKVKLAVRRNGFPSQQALAEELGMARSTVVKFLAGQPVDRAIFVDICEKLCLNCEEIAEFDMETLSVSSQATQIKSSIYGDLEEADDVSTFDDSQDKPNQVKKAESVRSLDLSSLDQEDKIIESQQQLEHLSVVQAEVTDFAFYVERPPIEERCYLGLAEKVVKKHEEN